MFQASIQSNKNDVGDQNFFCPCVEKQFFEETQIVELKIWFQKTGIFFSKVVR